MVIYPRFEYIITVGEIADEMYFIVRGVVEIRTRDNTVLATLKAGQNFGEMALLKKPAVDSLRMANAVA